MDTKRRSTTGCTACKRKRRKCDEGKPHCQRCISSKDNCSYEYIEHPSTARFVRRTKPAPRPLAKSQTRASRDTSAILEHTASLLPTSLESIGLTVPIDFATTATQENGIGHSFSLAVSSNTVNPLALFITSSLGCPQNDLLHIPPDSTQSIVDLEVPHEVGAPTLSSESELERAIQPDDGRSEIVEDYDPEGIQALLFITPIMDKNLKENTLPFVLQSYSQWALASIFEPLKVVHTMRDHVIQQFLSEDARTRIILIANVMSMSAKNPVVDETGASILAHLISSIQENIRSFLAAPPSHILAVDRRNARCVLENSMEVMTLQLFMGPMATGIQIIEDVAPVFRRACPGSPDQPLQLANILLEPELNLRHFVTADILTNILTGRPTCFKYEVAFSGELWERMLQLQGDYGLQCLQGLPDQFIMIFAWIYSLSEIPGASADTSLITWIESEIIQVRAVPGQLEDPALRIGRAAVREGWRSAALIYLYMVLGGADASDPRVVRAVKNFMRLVNGTKPGRIPDTHFSNAMVLIGVAACKERDRSVLRQRILNVPECSVPGTAGHATVLQLEDIWARTKNEGRAAVWADMRIANFRVIGI